MDTVVVAGMYAVFVYVAAVVLITVALPLSPWHHLVHIKHYSAIIGAEQGGRKGLKRLISIGYPMPISVMSQSRGWKGGGKEKEAGTAGIGRPACSQLAACAADIGILQSSDSIALSNSSLVRGPPG